MWWGRAEGYFVSQKKKVYFNYNDHANYETIKYVKKKIQSKQ